MPKQKQRVKRDGGADVQRMLPPGVKLLHTLRGHTGSIGRIAWSPDGKKLASPSDDGTIRIWDFETGECLRTLSGHINHVGCVVYDNTGRILVSSGGDHTLRFWDPIVGKQTNIFKLERSIRSLAFSNSGKLLAGGLTDGRINVWETSDDKLLHSFTAHMGTVLGIAFAPNGLLLASVATRDRSVRVWDVVTGKLAFKFEGPPGPITSVCFSNSGLLLAIGASNGVIQVWESGSGKILRTLEGHTGHVSAISFSHDSRLLATKGGDGTVRLWSCDTWAALTVIQEPTNGDWNFQGLFFHPHLPVLASVGSGVGVPKEGRDCVIHIWELDQGVLLGDLVEKIVYQTANVILVGDSGVGKTGLALRLSEATFGSTRSSGKLAVRRLSSTTVKGVTREILLWDLAGQRIYQDDHILNYRQASVALILIDGSDRGDLTASAEYWAKRIDEARGGKSVVKLLVLARADRSPIWIPKSDLDQVAQRFGFAGIFTTSASHLIFLPHRIGSFYCNSSRPVAGVFC